MEELFDNDLVLCFVCDVEISRNADTCPNCGEPDAGLQSVMIHIRKQSQEFQKKQVQQVLEKRRIARNNFWKRIALISNRVLTAIVGALTIFTIFDYFIGTELIGWVFDLFF